MLGSLQERRSVSVLSHSFVSTGGSLPTLDWQRTQTTTLGVPGLIPHVCHLDWQ